MSQRVGTGNVAELSRVTATLVDLCLTLLLLLKQCPDALGFVVGPESERPDDLPERGRRTGD